MRSRWRRRLITSGAVTLTFVASAVVAGAESAQTPQRPALKPLSIAADHVEVIWPASSLLTHRQRTVHARFTFAF